LLGWTNTTAIDHALRSIELAQEHRAQLLLCGHGDLVPLAYGLHRRAFGTGTPFIVCDPRRGNTPASVRSPANYVDVEKAFEAAAGGSLCVRRRRPPRDFSSLIARLRGSCDVQYICLEEDSLQWLVRPGPIEIPALAERTSELPRIVDEYVFDAIIELAPAPHSLVLPERDRRWLIERAATMSVSNVEKAALRLVALRSSPTLSFAPPGSEWRPCRSRAGSPAASCQRTWKPRARPEVRRGSDGTTAAGRASLSERRQRCRAALAAGTAACTSSRFVQGVRAGLPRRGRATRCSIVTDRRASDLPSTVFAALQ
jgi:hypothetical protein